MKKFEKTLLTLIITMVFAFLCGCDSPNVSSLPSGSENLIDASVKEESAEVDQPTDDSSNRNTTADMVYYEENSVLVESENTVAIDEKLTCTLSVKCDTILNNLSLLNSEKINIVPKDGIIFAEKTVVFYEGDSVFDLLLREMKTNNIHMEFVNTPLYDSAYIEGIANLYEFDCGKQSGWVYKVNGQLANYGCSLCELKAGDRVEWVYTCNSGADVVGN